MDCLMLVVVLQRLSLEEKCVGPLEQIFVCAREEKAGASLQQRQHVKPAAALRLHLHLGRVDCVHTDTLRTKRRSQLDVRGLARRHVHHADDQPADPELLRRLRDPLFVFGLPTEWTTERCNPGVEQDPSSRVWSFVYTDEGIRVNRSQRLTIRQVLDFARAGVYA